MVGIVVVFDFDKTIIDLDSDNWVVDELGATDLFNELLPTMPWNSLMDRMMMELHEQGRTIDDIADVLKRAPMHPDVVPAIKAAHALRIVSDANLFYIDTILNHLGIRECFSEIHTNPSLVDEEGRLRIFPIHKFSKSPHDFCPPNMCKGLVMERIQASLMAEGKTKKRFIYLGDGNGDYCPSLKLGEGDFLMPRKNFPLWDLISQQNPLVIKAEIHEWSDGEEMGRILLRLINSISMAENAQFLSPQNMAVAVHEAEAGFTHSNPGNGG
ncbi:inorganic pyrophosphatase 2-like isoform X2 [Benincasa hispida]|uniref:inorganic pyrophosphatase 2-like isoform X2 n=1 Tax=Benincasa hispida TaxID=102211 RepID=UPI0019015516|nr:inorganic pyrophosphatase 2-like isoform X2 [Benincasa hispida]